MELNRINQELSMLNQCLLNIEVPVSPLKFCIMILSENDKTELEIVLKSKWGEYKEHQVLLL